MYNLGAEKAVIGSILLNNSSVYKIISLDDDMFSPESRPYIIKAKELHSSGTAVDVITLGGSEYLTSCLDTIPTASHIDSYIEEVKNAYKRSQLRDLGEKIQYMAEAGDDPLEYALKGLNKITSRSVGSEFMTLSGMVDSEAKRIEDSIANERYVQGISTGFHRLDAITGGLGEGELIILAGRPSLGKSTLAINIADHADLAGLRAGIVSLEMSGAQIFSKIVSKRLRINSRYLQTGDLRGENLRKFREGIDDIRNTHIVIDDKSRATLSAIKANAYAQKANYGLDILIIDYLQLMGGDKKSRDNRVEEVSSISRGLKLLARELNIPIIALSQFSRSVEARPNKKPQLSDLRESGSIEQDADKALLLWQPPNDVVDNESPEIEIIVAKNRMGATGNIRYRFFKKYNRFQEYDLPENKAHEIKEMFSAEEIDINEISKQF